jgi:site-specific DNA recombinase
MVRRLFELYSTARYSIKDLGALVREERLMGRSNRPLPTSTAHKILHSRVYCGEFEWAGCMRERTSRSFRGNSGSRCNWHLTAVWAIAQRSVTTPSRSRVCCGHCGYAPVGEIKKRKYVYYRCRALRGTCTLAYVPQEEIERDFERVLRMIVIDE